MDVSSTYPVSIIEISCFVLVYHDITENRWKHCFYFQLKCLTHLKNTQNNNQHMGSCLCILMTIKQLFVFNWLSFRTHTYSYRICNLIAKCFVQKFNRQVWQPKNLPGTETDINFHPESSKIFIKCAIWQEVKWKTKVNVIIWYVFDIFC